MKCCTQGEDGTRAKKMWLFKNNYGVHTTRSITIDALFYPPYLDLAGL